MKNILFLGIALIFAAFSFSQQDEKAKEILKNVSEKTRSYNTISVKFILTMDVDEMDIHEKNEGSLIMKGEKYAVDLPDIGTKVISNGTTLWNYTEEGDWKQVTISSIEEGSTDLMNPSSLFNIYEKGFKSKYAGEKTKNSEPYYQIELFPDSDEHDILKVILLIGKSDMMIKSVQFLGTDEKEYGIEVIEMNTVSELPDSLFVFNPKEYSNLEVIDFRETRN